MVQDQGNKGINRQVAPDHVAKQAATANKRWPILNMGFIFHYHDGNDGDMQMCLID